MRPRDEISHHHLAKTKDSGRIHLSWSWYIVASVETVLTVRLVLYAIQATGSRAIAKILLFLNTIDCLSSFWLVLYLTKKLIQTYPSYWKIEQASLKYFQKINELVLYLPSRNYATEFIYQRWLQFWEVFNTPQRQQQEQEQNDRYAFEMIGGSRSC